MFCSVWVQFEEHPPVGVRYAVYTLNLVVQRYKAHIISITNHAFRQWPLNIAYRNYIYIYIDIYIIGMSPSEVEMRRSTGVVSVRSERF